MDQSAPGRRDIKWVDGLRGIASVFVVTSHIIRALAPQLLAPATTDGGRPTLFQRPFVRLPVQGPAWVALFFVLSGYVNAIKPIKMARAGTTDSTLSTIARNVFRRSGRLVLPSALATILSWALCQLHGYQLAKSSDSEWLRNTSPEPIPSVTGSLASLQRNLLSTWVDGANHYDEIQWTLPYLLKGSMTVFMTLVATVYAKPLYRILLVLGLYAFSWRSADAVLGMNVFAGILVAELTAGPSLFTGSSHCVVGALVPLALIPFGLFACSYPEFKPEWSSWSRNLLGVGGYIFPSGSEIWRFWPAVGMHCLIIGILFSTRTKGFLSHSTLLWLGSISFPMYLLHGPLMRSVMSWILFGILAPFSKKFASQNGKVKDGMPGSPDLIPIPALWSTLLILPLFFCFLFWVSHLWVVHVEPWCASATRWMEERIFVEADEKLPLA